MTARKVGAIAVDVFAVTVAAFVIVQLARFAIYRAPSSVEGTMMTGAAILAMFAVCGGLWIMLTRRTS